MNIKMRPACILLIPVLLHFLLAEQGSASEDLSAATGNDRVELDPLVVVAGKTPRPMSEVAAQVTVIDVDDIRQGMAEDLDSILKYEPGLEIETAGTRFGATAINIRGVGGNRVAIEIDGIPAINIPSQHQFYV